MPARLAPLLAALVALPGTAAAFPWPPRQPPVTGLVANADARVGDWVTHRTAGPGGVTRKQTVVARAAGWVTVREEYPDSKRPPVEYAAWRAGPKPAGRAAPKNAGDAPVVEVLGSGQETLAVGGTKYECRWSKTRITIPGQASLTRYVEAVEIVRTRWACPDVPVAGEVRTAVEVGGHAVTWELTGHGRGK